MGGTRVPLLSRHPHFQEWLGSRRMPWARTRRGASVTWAGRVRARTCRPGRALHRAEERFDVAASAAALGQALHLGAIPGANAAALRLDHRRDVARDAALLAAEPAQRLAVVAGVRVQPPGLHPPRHQFSALPAVIGPPHRDHQGRGQQQPATRGGAEPPGSTPARPCPKSTPADRRASWSPVERRSSPHARGCLQSSGTPVLPNTLEPKVL